MLAYFTSGMCHDFEVGLTECVEVLVSFWHYKQVETAVSVEFVSFLPGNE